MNRARIASLIGLTTLAACQPNSTSTPSSSARPRTASLRNATTSERVAGRGGRVSSFDASGAPQFVWATTARPALPGQNAEQAARAHLRWFAPALELDA